MKKSMNLSGKKTLMLFTVASTFLLFSCANKMSFGVSPIVPAAEGSVKVKSDKNKNYTVDLSVVRLSEPSRLTPSKSAYVVWMQTEDNGVKNLGNLTTGSGLFSSTLKASLHTSTPFKPSSFFITAEDNITPTLPSGFVILRTK